VAQLSRDPSESKLVMGTKCDTCCLYAHAWPKHDSTTSSASSRANLAVNTARQFEMCAKTLQC
jgi:hypothetical protein